MEAAIKERAAGVRVMGMHLGIFDWLCFQAVKRVRVLTLFGSEVVDTWKIFGLALPPITFDRTHHVAAVRLRGGSLRVPDGLGAGINHFVIGVPAKEHAFGPSCGDADQPSCARKAGLRAGWLLKDTVADGNCAPDCMCHMLGLPRNAASWRTMRNDVADYMESVAADERWHNAFRGCGEAASRDEEADETSTEVVVLAAPSGLGSVPSAVPAVPSGFEAKLAVPSGLEAAPSGLEAVPSVLEAKPAVSSVLEAVPSGLKTTPALSSGLEAVPSEVASAPSGLEAKPVVSSGLEAVPSGLEVVPSGVSFLAWLQSLSEDKLASISADYLSFKAAEERWLAHQPAKQASSKGPRATGQRRSSNIKYKMATGVAYLAWREGTGKASRAPLKDRWRFHVNEVYVRACVRACVTARARRTCHARDARCVRTYVRTQVRCRWYARTCARTYVRTHVWANVTCSWLALARMCVRSYVRIRTWVYVRTYLRRSVWGVFARNVRTYA